MEKGKVVAREKPSMPSNAPNKERKYGWRYLKYEILKTRFLIVYFQCIRKYKDYTFDYDDMAG